MEENNNVFNDDELIPTSRAREVHDDSAITRAYSGQDVITDQFREGKIGLRLQQQRKETNPTAIFANRVLFERKKLTSVLLVLSFVLLVLELV